MLQVSVQITKDIDQLKALAKPNPILNEKPLVNALLGEEVCYAHARPEFSNTAGHPVRVVIQLIGRSQSNNVFFGGGTEPAQIQFLATDDDVEHPTDAILILRRQ